ncbi:MAG: molecular chaperone [Candidatus Bathyarchaeia archaeon]
MGKERHNSFASTGGLAESRGRIYAFLSSIYLQVPTVDFVESSLKTDYRSMFASVRRAATSSTALMKIREGLRVIEDSVKRSGTKPREKICEELAVSHTRLFRGVKPEYSPPPPYESVYREGRVMGESTLAVQQKYRQAHAKPAGHLDTEPPDSIGLELGFMHFLCEKEAYAWRGNDNTAVSRFLNLEKEFLKGHILEWIPRFCKEARKVCKEIGQDADFYLGIIEITDGFIKIDNSIVSYLLEILRGSKDASPPSA